MSAASETVYGLGTTAIVVAPGATQAQYFTQASGQNSTLVKYGSGGTLYIVGMGSGVTLSAANLVTNASAHYLMGSSEALSLNGPVSCYFLALSATTTVYIIRGLSAGY